MFDIPHDLTNRAPRRGGVVVALGAAAGGMFLAAIGQLAAAPEAHADPFSDVFDAIEGSISVSNADFSNGAADFSSGDILDGSSFDLAGTNDVLLAPGEDAMVIGYDALAGDPEPQYLGFGIEIPPSDLAEGLTSAQEDIATGQQDFAAALSDFAGNNVASGLALSAAGFNESFAYAPDDVILGLAASPLGDGSTGGLNVLPDVLLGL